MERLKHLVHINMILNAWLIIAILGGIAVGVVSVLSETGRWLFVSD